MNVIEYYHLERRYKSRRSTLQFPYGNCKERIVNKTPYVSSGTHMAF